MIDKLMKLKAKGKEMSPTEKEAKMSVVEAMRKLAEDEMGERLQGLKKVTVAAPDQDGLKAGLEKAKEVVGEVDELEEDAEEGEELAEDEEIPMSEEEINAKIEELLKLKEAMKAKA